MLINFIDCISYSRSCRLRSLNSNFKYLFMKKYKNCINKQILCHLSNESKSKNMEEFVPFLDIINSRRMEAKRSILVQVQSSQSVQELHSYCSLFGTVKKMFHYITRIEQLNFIIVEFMKDSHINNIMQNTSHLNDDGYPVHSNFMWFKASNRKDFKLKQTNDIQLDAENGNKLPVEEDITNALRSCKNVSEQIITLYNMTKLNEVATRLRFLTTLQIESAISGLFPNTVAYPFGSSVNGCGKMGCDLDVVLRLTSENIKKESRLMFHCKAVNGYERSVNQKHMEVIGDLIQLFLPGCTQIRKILQARVPIIKYYQQLTDVECDLSMSNMSGVHMSDLLYLYGSMDPRVRPLIFTIKKWAKSVGITNNSPGRWITNFSLTLLVIAFFQNPNLTSPILPSLNTLVNCADKNDEYVTEDGVNCTFLRDLKNFDHECNNEDNLELLLKQFCEFYATFDYAQKSININEAVAITKPEHSPLYIVNPLERGLNVSKNVSLEELHKFKYALRSAAWALESQENNEENWGILGMFENKSKINVHTHAIPRKQGRLMEVSKLFVDSPEESDLKQSDFKTKTAKDYQNPVSIDTNVKDNNVNIERQKSRR